MPEPTDHRAQAEHWVREFLDSIGPAAPNRQDMLRLAHIHALLAGPPDSPINVVHLPEGFAMSEEDLQRLKTYLTTPPVSR